MAAIIIKGPMAQAVYLVKSSKHSQVQKIIHILILIQAITTDIIQIGTTARVHGPKPL